MQTIMDKLLELGRQVKKMDYIAAWTWSQTVGFIEGFVKGYKAQLNLLGLTDDCVLPKTIGKLYELGFEETCVRSVLDITHNEWKEFTQGYVVDIKYKNEFEDKLHKEALENMEQFEKKGATIIIFGGNGSFLCRLRQK